MKTLLITLALLAVGGCTNQTTPEGHEGYVVHVPLVFGKSHFVKSMKGPSSTGVVWRQYVSNVDVRPKNYTEDFHILSADNLNVGFQAHARIAIRAGGVKELIETLGGGGDVQTADGKAFPRWYARNVQQPYRTAVRDVVHKYDAYSIQAKTQEIGVKILNRLQETYADTPIEFETISIGNLAYPEAINLEIQRKLAAEQDLERMARERQIAVQEAQIVVTRAKGRAAAQKVVNETLTPLYVQHEMLESFRYLARSKRVTVVVSPVGKNGGSPMILNVDK